MTIHGLQEAVNYHMELQPLLKKDGPTIATAIINATQEVLDCCLNGLTQNPNKLETLRFASHYR